MIRIAPSNRVIHSFRSSFTTVLKLGTRERIRWKVEESMNLPDSRESFRSLENEKATSSESPGTRVPFPRDDLSPTDTVLVAFTDNSVHAKYSSLHILLSLLPPPTNSLVLRVLKFDTRDDISSPPRFDGKKFIKRNDWSNGASYRIESNLLIRPPAHRGLLFVAS